MTTVEESKYGCALLENSLILIDIIYFHNMLGSFHGVSELKEDAFFW